MTLSEKADIIIAKLERLEHAAEVLDSIHFDLSRIASILESTFRPGAPVPTVWPTLAEGEAEKTDDGETP